MKPDTTSVRLILMVSLALVLSLITLPVLKVTVETALPGPAWLQELVRLEPAGAPTEWDAAPSYTYDLGRVSRRYLSLVALVVFVALRRWVPWSVLARRGFRTADRGRHLGFGFAAGFGMVVVYAAILVLGDTVTWTDPSPGYLVRRSVDFALGAAFIALLEEYVFRGVFFRAMLRDWGVTWAVVGSGSVFAVLHCISGSLRVAPGWDPAIGFELFEMYFTSGGSLIPDLRLMVGLFLFSGLLCYLYLRSGALWLPIGLHGAMVFSSKIMKKALSRDPDFPEWLLGDSLFLVSGVACWALLLATLWLMTRIAPRGPLYRRLARRP